MGSSITVRDIDPGDQSWLKCEARQVGVSMEEFVRRLIREKRAKAERWPTPSRNISVSSMGWNCRSWRVTATGRCRSPLRTRNDRTHCLVD